MRSRFERRVVFRQGVRNGACVSMIHQNMWPMTEEAGVPSRTEPVAVTRGFVVFYRQLQPHALSTQPSYYWDIRIQNKAGNIRLTLRRVRATIVAVENQ